MLSHGKASGSDSIPADIYKKSFGDFLKRFRSTKLEVTTIKQLIFNNHVTSLCFQKQNNILTKLLNRLTADLKIELLSESQCGFRKNLETNKMMLTARKLQKNV